MGVPGADRAEHGVDAAAQNGVHVPKDHKKDGEVKQFSVNGKDGIIKMEFNDHEKALVFY